ncbi:uncharacterized protein QC761_108095 [Podospora bellae-mahoneyi]|uniref:Uncharacterized protein n=1 Tax=Podospora bellae-mahoneyi TaxID=2093777 RepID=A0ABR0FW85_9PEZI|nr:hypothetical protein QC761_108095 [Podospora bellae-mahoneyi]
MPGNTSQPSRLHPRQIILVPSGEIQTSRYPFPSKRARRTDKKSKPIYPSTGLQFSRWWWWWCCSVRRW